MTEQAASSKPRLGRDVYIALAAIGWADGQLDQEEADAIVRTALDEGLELDEIAEIEEATKAPIDLGVIDRRGMSKEDRLFVYGVAVWLAQLDGRVTDEEQGALARLGESLGVPEKARQSVALAVRQVTELSEDDRPARYDLAALRRILGERLKRAEERKAQGA